MNRVELIGRLTRNPDIWEKNELTIASFSIAIDRTYGENKKTDFPRVTAFGKTAEAVEKYLRKGARIAVEGSLQTGSYTDEDEIVHYTTDVIASRVEIIDWPEEDKEEKPKRRSRK